MPTHAEEERIIKLMAACRLDPVKFIRIAYPWGTEVVSGSTGPRKWQNEINEKIRDHLQNPDTRFQPLRIAVASGHGCGKLHDYNLMLDVPSGKKRWGDLKEGDFVFGSSGEPVRIIKTHHYENVPMYRVTFDDKSFSEVSEGHLWNVRGRQERRNKLDTWRTLETKDILEIGVKRPNGTALARQWEIPLQGPAHFEEREIDLHPYFVGIWLGDGSKGQPAYTKPYHEIAEKIKSLGYELFLTNNGKTYKLQGIKHLMSDPVFKLGSHERYIPDDYKYNTIENRMAIFQGLCDSYGETNECGSIGFSSTSKRLAEDMIWLARSLGCKAILQEAIKKGWYPDENGERVECRDCWRVTINAPFNPFTLKHRKEKYKPSEKRYLIRWIDAIEPIASTNGMCITVENQDGLYLTNDFIVTHNSAEISMLIDWALSTCTDTKVVVTANTEVQLRTKTWPEVNRWMRMSLNSHWFNVTATAISSRDPERQRTWRADAISWSEDNTESFAGLHNKGRRILLIMDEACHDEQTEVMTNMGWKFFKDLGDDDRLLTMDQSTGIAEYLRPDSLHYSKKSGNMIRYSRRGASFFVTENHRMLVISQGGKKSFRTAGELASKKNLEVMIPRKVSWSSPDVDFITIPALTTAKRNYKERKFAADDFAAFLGWHCSEGNLVYSFGRYRSVGFTNNDINPIRILCERLGIKSKIYKVGTSGCYQLRIHDTQMAEWFSQFGVGCLNKRIPDVVRTLSPRQIDLFLNAYRDGDGYRKGNRDIFYTSCKKLADGLQELIFLAGQQSSVMMRILKDKVSIIEGHKATSSTDGYVVSRTWADSEIILRTKYLEKVQYDGYVYCATLPNHGLLFTRRDGVCMWSGNSSISDKIWEVSEGALTDENTEIIWIAFGNPTRNTGRFRECFGRFKHRWITRQIDSRNVEGTNKQELDQWIRDYGEDSDFARVRVKGEFPRAGSMQFIPGDIVDEARKRQPYANLQDPVVMGVDVGRFGNDPSCIVTRRGRDATLIPWVTMMGADTMTVAARVMEEAQKHKPDAIFIDGGGVGGGVVDRLRQLKLPVIEIQFGARADYSVDTQSGPIIYANKRAEMWGSMRDWLKGASIPDDPNLASELVGVEYGYVLRDGKDAILLEKKEDMKKRGLSSPNAADALCLTFAHPVMKSDHRSQIENKKSQHQYEWSYNPRS